MPKEIKHGLDYSLCTDAHSLQSSFTSHMSSQSFSLREKGGGEGGGNTGRGEE